MTPERALPFPSRIEWENGGNGRWELMGRKFVIQGIVQGVGFRPFVYRLASELGLNGRVANTTDGVVIEVEGTDTLLDRFSKRLLAERPPLARIDRIEETSLSISPEIKGFTVTASQSTGRKRLLITPDSDVCDNCLAELRDPGDRRFAYPFINCTDCGPRYTIIEDLPYDRTQTAMRAFAMCKDCQNEYEDPSNRRFHAEAICCPVCGPRLWAADSTGGKIDGDPIKLACLWLNEGLIVAIKGIGGFHLAVDAVNEEAVKRLRLRKNRPDKPLAVMCRDLKEAEKFADFDEASTRLLTDRTKPVVLLDRKTPFALADSVAPDNRYIGVMLPYTPVHHLLFAQETFTALVMTSANLSGEPIVCSNSDALEKLSAIADRYLFHDRPILTSTDDSVVRPQTDPPIYLRRARGLSPVPLPLPIDCGNILAVGADVKSTVCITRGREAFVSQHIGDLDLLATQLNLERTCRHFLRLLQVEPALVVHDLHPDYFSSSFAESLGMPTAVIQHHHAHAVSCMAENGITSPVIALCMDGTGFGPDGSVWGGEVLIAKAASYSRAAHLRQVRMPGGEAAVREPWRMALSYLHSIFGDTMPKLPFLDSHMQEKEFLLQALVKKINAPLTSSCGRLFDAVAAMIGLREKISFEGQAAMALEMLAAPRQDLYPFAILKEENSWIINTFPMIEALVSDLLQGESPRDISGRFHNSLATMLAETCRLLRKELSINQVVLSGGVFQNTLLTKIIRDRLKDLQFQIFTHQLLPPNDACISYGQAVAGREKDIG